MCHDRIDGDNLPFPQPAEPPRNAHAPAGVVEQKATGITPFVVRPVHLQGGAHAPMIAEAPRPFVGQSRAR